MVSHHDRGRPSYVQVEDAEARQWQPKVAYFDDNNHMKRLAKALPVQVA